MPSNSESFTLANMRSQRELAKERVKDLIHSGKLLRDGYMPPIRKVSEAIGFNRDAVWKAYRELESEGYIKATENRRYVIQSSFADKHLRMLDARLITVGEDSIRFSGLQRFHQTLTDKQSEFGIRTHLKCVMDAEDIQPEWLEDMDFLILGGYFAHSKILDALAKKIPTVGVIASNEWQPSVSIDTDNPQMGRLAAKRLIEAGAAAPAVVAYANQERRHLLRKIGFQAKWVEDGASTAEIPEFWIDPGNFRRAVELEEVARSLEGCDSVFCLEKESAIDLLAILKHIDVRVPDDIKVISADGTFEGLQTSPKLTYVKQQFETMASIAAEKARQLCTRSDPRTSETEKILVPSELVPRESA